MTTIRHIPLETDRMIGRIKGGIGWMTFNNPERRKCRLLRHVGRHGHDHGDVRGRSRRSRDRVAWCG
jgi:hypothetical protein